MSGTADPWEPPSIAALGYDVTHSPDVIHGDGPMRIYDDTPTIEPRRPIGFAAQMTETEPLLWEGDNA